MGKQILSYKTFSSSKNFEKWQETEDVNICFVNPIAGGFSLETTGDMAAQESSANVDLYIFVLYYKK